MNLSFHSFLNAKKLVFILPVLLASSLISAEALAAPPVIENVDGDAFSYDEGAGSESVDRGVAATVTDADSADFENGSLTLTISAGGAAEDRLEIDTTGTVSLSAGLTADSTVSENGTAVGTIQAGATGGSGEALTIALNSDATPARVEVLVRALQYRNINAENPDTTARTLRLTIDDGDGETSANADVTITVNGINDLPTGAPLATDFRVTEDTASVINLSFMTFTDVDGDILTLTVAASAGTFSTPADGASVGAGVTESLVNATTITLVGLPEDITTYLDTATNLQYTSPGNAFGNDRESITLVLNDGNGSGDITLATINVDISGVNDAPELDMAQSPILTGINEDAGDDDGSSADGDDDATDNANNAGTSVAAMVVDGSITDVDGGALEAIAVTAVGNANGVWQFSTDGGTSWSNFSGTTGSTVDISSNARLLDSAHLMRFVPDVNYAGTAALTFRAWDKTTGAAGNTADTSSNGNTTAFSSQTDTAGITVTGVNDAPVLDNSQAPVLSSIGEDAGDDDGSGADGDDDGANNSNNSGTTVAALVVDASITDIDGAPVEAIAVTGVDNSNGVWQFSTNAGSTWSNFSGTTGAVVDIASAARLLDSANTIRFVPDAGYIGSATVTFRAWDKSAGVAGNTADTSTNGADSAISTQTDTASVSVIAVNDAPVFSGLDGTPAYTEGSAAQTLDGDVTISDAELVSGADYAGASLAIARNGGSNANDDFGFDAAGASFTVSGGNLQSGGQTFATFTDAAGTLTINFTSVSTAAIQALVNAVLQRIVYQNTSNDPVATVQLDWAFGDGNSANAQGSGDNPATASGFTTVTITNVNDAPTLTATGGNPDYTEGNVASDLYNTVTADTVEDSNTTDRFTSMTLTVTNINDGESEKLRFDGTDIELTDGNSETTANNGLTITVTVAGSTATLAFSGATLTEAQLQTLVDGLSYRNTSDNPTTGSSRAVTITSISDNGGSANGGNDASAPNLQSTVSLIAVNDPPVVANVDGESSIIIADNGAQAVSLFDDATVTNADSYDYNGGSLVVTQSTGTINGSWGVGVASSPSVTVTSGGDAGITASDIIAVDGVSLGTVDAADDGQGGSNLQIDFNSANATSARIQSLVQALTYSAPSGLGARTFTLTLNDGDSTVNGGDEDTTANFTLNITPNPPVVSSLDGDSVSAANGVAVAIDQGGNAMVTDADSGNFNGGNLTVTRTSGFSGDFTVDGTNVTSGGDTVVSGTESIVVGGTTIGTVTSDGQGSNALVITFSTTDATPALVQTLMRNLQFVSTNAGAHTFDLTITDAGASAAISPVASFTINVSAPPVNTVPGGQSGVDGTAGTISGVSVADADSVSVTTTLTTGSGTITVTPGGASVIGNGTGNVVISGTIAEVNAALAGLAYTPQVNSSGAQSLTVVTSDGSNSDSDAITVTVSDRPDLSGLSGTVSFPAGSAGVLLDDAMDASVSDVDSGNFNGGTLTLSISAGGVPAEDLLTLDGSATISVSGLSAGDDVLVGGTVVGTLGNAIAAGNDLVVSFNGNATPARVSLLVQALRYENTQSASPTVGARTIGLTISDGVGGNEVNATITVNVAVPSAPTTPTTEGDDEGGTTLVISGNFQNGGTLNNVFLGPGATLSGGTVTDNIIGDADDPALVNSNIGDNAYLENVIIGSGSTLGPGVRFGPGVSFETPDILTPSIDLSGIFNAVESTDDPALSPALNLDVSLFGGQSLLESIQALDVFGLSGNQPSQNPVTGELVLQIGNIRSTLRPVMVTQVSKDVRPGIYITEDGDVAIVNATGQQVICYPALNDIDVMSMGLGGLSLNLDERANLRISRSNGPVVFTGRSDIKAVPATRSSVPGLHFYTLDRPANTPGVSLIYEDENGELLQQDITPVPDDWLSLKATLLSVLGVDSVRITTTGVISIVINGQTLQAIADYRVQKAADGESGSASVIFSSAGDLNGDGSNDFTMRFPNGSSQWIYILPE